MASCCRWLPRTRSTIAPLTCSSPGLLEHRTCSPAVCSRATANSPRSKQAASASALLPARLDAGAAVRIAVRPENVRLGEDSAARSTDNRFTARVAARRYQGTQTIYELAA